MEFGGRLSKDEFWRRFDEQTALLRARLSLVPLYGVRGWAGQRIAMEWETVNDRLTEICLMHGEPGPGPSVAVWTTAADNLEHALDRERTTAPWLVGNGAVRAITVGVRRERFRTWIHDEYWVAAGGPFRNIVAAGRGIAIDEVQLVRVSIDPYMAGRREWMIRKIGNKLD